MKVKCPGATACTPSDSGAQRTLYFYDADGELAMEVGPPVSPCWTCYVTVDRLGSTRLVTDGAGNIVRRYDYLPFGQEIPADGTVRTTSSGFQAASDGFNPKFTGQMRDPETGLDYFNLRYYSPEQGRFVSPDPENAGADPSEPQSWNGYAYALNNPLLYVDPDGLDSITATGTGTTSGGNNWSFTFGASYGGSFDFFYANPFGNYGQAQPQSNLAFAPLYGPYSGGNNPAQKLIGAAKAVPHDFVSWMAGDKPSPQENKLLWWLRPSNAAQETGFKTVQVYQIITAVGSGIQVLAAMGRGRHIALGLSDYLQEFAKKRSAVTYKQLSAHDPFNWKKYVLDEMNNSDSVIHFNLDGIDSVWAAVTRASRGGGGATDWELLQIHRGIKAPVKWYKNGAEVASPWK